jgi:ABC-type branched-subunit amino acid transport system substrate-binding protein
MDSIRRVIPRSAGSRRFGLGAVLLVGALLAACGGGGSKSGGSSQSSGQATGSTIKIGDIVDISAGPFAVTGASNHIATDMVVAQVNANGGINGHRLEVVYADAKGDPALALSLGTQLVQQDHVDVLIGAAGSPECLGLQQLAPKLQIVYMPTNGCANEQFSAQSCNKYSFRIDPVGKQQAGPAADYLVKTYGKRWVIMYSDYAYGQSQNEAYKAAFAASGGSVLNSIPVPLGQTDVTPYVTKIPTDGTVDGVFLGAEPQGLARMAAGIQQFAVNKKIAIAGVGTREQYGGVYPDALNGSIGTPTVHISDPLPDNKDDQAFEAAFKDAASKAGQLADVFGGASKVVPGQNGYAAYIAVTSLKRAMINAKFSGRADTSKLIDALENLNIPQGPDAPDGSIVMNKPDHQGKTTTFLYKINGQKDEVIATVPTDKIPNIGDCKAS